MSSRKAIDYTGSGKTLADVSLGQRGVAGSIMVEPKPRYIKSDSEEVIGKNAEIVIGRDRPGSRLSGCGAEMGASRIDIVVGRMSADNLATYDRNGEEIYVDPSMKKDAARIYISQKANIDGYFKLAAGKVGKSTARSGIGIKADAVRIIGREGIKLITRPESKNSQGGKIEFVKGIDLIAGNDDSGLQPMVKGDDLISLLISLVDQIGQLNGIVQGNLTAQMTVNTAMLAHTHAIPGSPLPDPVFQGIVAGMQSKLGIQGAISQALSRVGGEFLKMKYLKPVSPTYILSRYNNTN